MAVFSPTNAKLHFKAYDGNFTDALGNVTISQHNSVSMSSAQTIFGQQAMFMSDFMAIGQRMTGKSLVVIPTTQKRLDLTCRLFMIKTKVILLEKSN